LLLERATKWAILSKTLRLLDDILVPTRSEFVTRLMILKLKRTPGLYLVGFMASGKTTVGRALADHIGWPFVDMDAEIESREGKSISQIFQERGEAGFRVVEAEVLRSHVRTIEAGIPCVLALGGGAFVQPGNRELIQNNGVSLWIDCPLDIIQRRLNGDTTRPLTAHPNGLGRLYEDRRPVYSRADYRVEVDTEDVTELVHRILGLPLFVK
jgi:shikimate kinase